MTTTIEPGARSGDDEREPRVIEGTVLEPGAGVPRTSPAQTADPTAAGSGAPSAAPKHDLPVLEAYRGIAALLVLLGHVGFSSGVGVIGTWAGWLSRSDFGVTLFFLLSGFLLFRPFVQASYGRRPPVKAGSYLRRRYVRIYPAFALTLAGVWLLSERAREQGTDLWWQTFLLVQNYNTSFTNQLDGLVQIWSLCVEVSFYVALPLIAYVCLGRGTALAAVERARGVLPGARAAAPPPVAAPAVSGAQPMTRREARELEARRQREAEAAAAAAVVDDAPPRGRLSLPAAWQPYRPAIVFALITVFSLAWRVYFTATNDGYNSQVLWLPAFMDWFVAGMALAWLRERPVPPPLWIRQLANTPGVCFSLALAGYWLTTQRGIAGPFDLGAPTLAQMMTKHVVYEIIAVLVLLPAVFGAPSAGWRRFALHPVMRWLGQISFGVFLWHPILMETIRRILDYPVFGGGFWVTLILTLITSLIVGTLSYRYVEEPTQRRFRNGLRDGLRGGSGGSGSPPAVPRIKFSRRRDPEVQALEL